MGADRTSAGKPVDRAGFAEDSQGSVDKLFVDTAVAVMENSVAAVADWELEKLVAPEPIPTHWEFELCTADRGPVEIDWEPVMWEGLAPIPWHLEFELGTAARELAKSAVLGWALEDRFAQFAVDFEGLLEGPAAAVASGWGQVDRWDCSAVDQSSAALVRLAAIRVAAKIEKRWKTGQYFGKFPFI